jgi:predicted nucleotidyltransferase
MATTLLPRDFKEFLRSLNSREVRYLLIGGYAVGYYGYVRATADLDVWVEPTAINARKVVAALNDFGIVVPELTEALFTARDQVARIGVPPIRIELLTSISGVEFEECYSQRLNAVLDEVSVPVISLEHLKTNKKASGRLKDLNDLEMLP